MSNTHFECSEPQDIENVANQYEQSYTVTAFLKWACSKDLIKPEPYDEVYAMIKIALGLDKNNFDCSKNIEYVAKQYEQQQIVEVFLKWACNEKLIQVESYSAVYTLIKNSLGLSRK